KYKIKKPQKCCGFNLKSNLILYQSLKYGAEREGATRYKFTKTHNPYKYCKDIIKSILTMLFNLFYYCYKLH
ncbi:MAG: hypothetical protein KDE33_16845, partial [Bacteroidetes bacterium]|nr:hypothetical protein [Bacteroidota bacterium]